MQSYVLIYSLPSSMWFTLQAFHKAGCGPPVYATFKNGLVYGYIHGDTLDLDSVRDPGMAR